MYFIHRLCLSLSWTLKEQMSKAQPLRSMSSLPTNQGTSKESQSTKWVIIMMCLACYVERIQRITIKARLKICRLYPTG